MRDRPARQCTATKLSLFSQKKIDTKTKHLLKLIDNFLKKDGKKLEEKRKNILNKDKLSKKQIIEDFVFICGSYIELQFVMCDYFLEQERKNENISIKDTDWVAGYIFGLLDGITQISIIKGDMVTFYEIYKKLLLKFKIFNKKKVSDYDLYIENGEWLLINLLSICLMTYRMASQFR